MLPVVSIVGRPNVGKSTLFNALTKTRDALVIDQPGSTRDRQYGRAFADDKPYILIDTGGLSGEEEGITALMADQVRLAVIESDLVLFLVDGREGLNQHDFEIAKFLRTTGKSVVLAVNKTDGVDEEEALLDFYQLGFERVIPLSASHRRGLLSLAGDYISPICMQYEENAEENLDPKEGIKMAIIGRPNVGKSTLVNRMLGEERVVVFDMPGTTRDSIYIPYERHEKKYVLIDTAGLRRRGKVEEVVEKFSVVKTLQAIADANVVICVMDATEGITEQDLHVLGFALEAGRAMVVAINKWDGLSEEQKKSVKDDLTWRFDFIKHVRVHFISAKHGTGVGNLYESVHEAYDAAFKEISTSKLNRALEGAVSVVEPPMSKGRRIKLKFAHMGGHNPPLIIIHGSQVDKLPESYQRYLMGVFREEFDLMGTPLKLEFKVTENPYKDKYKKLTPRQERTEKRLAKRRGEAMPGKATAKSASQPAVKKTEVKKAAAVKKTAAKKTATKKPVAKKNVIRNVVKKKK